jgi:hypothetical protein
VPQYLAKEFDKEKSGYIVEKLGGMANMKMREFGKYQGPKKIKKESTYNKYLLDNDSDEKEKGARKKSRGVMMSSQKGRGGSLADL